MEPKEKLLEGVPTPERYGRDSLQKRLDGMKPWQLKCLDDALNRVGFDFEQLGNCVKSPELLDEADVEAFMRELAIIIGSIRNEFDPQSTSVEKVNALNKSVKDLIIKYNL